MLEQLKKEVNLQNVVIKSINNAPYPIHPFQELAKKRQKENESKNPYKDHINQDTNIDDGSSNGINYRSILNTPVLTNLQFTGATYTDSLGNQKTFKTLVFEAILVTVSQSKNIVTTAIQGRDGTVKEYIGQGDYSITINGIITGMNGHYPKDEVRDFKDMLNAGVAIEIASWYLQNLDVSTIVIQDYDIEQEAGGYSYQKFSISAISDTPQEIKIFN
jgi:hypothetical protein